MTIGENIKRLRQKKGLSQQQLGKLCHPEMADSAIRRYEAGKANPKLETLYRIATALDVNVFELYEDNNNSAQTFDLTDLSNNDQIMLILSNFNNLLQKGTLEIENSEGNIERYSLKTFDSKEDEFLMLFRKLNETGKKEALKRIQELTEIPRYQDNNS